MIIQAQNFGPLEALAIVLSLVSLIVTVVGFFASLKFYRDGVELQRAANDALTKIGEKTEFIQTQVGGMFDKTLDAAIGKREILSYQFEELNDQLEKTKAKLIEESIGQIGAAGEQERKRLTNVVDNQIAIIREKIETTRESAQEMVQYETITPLMNNVLKILAAHPEGLTAREIGAAMPPGVSSKHSLALPSKLVLTLREMIDRGDILTDNDKFFIAGRTRNSVD